MDDVKGLEKEIELYEARRKEWAANNAGDFVVIRGSEIAGFHKSYEAALRAGLLRFGVGAQFLVKQVCAEEPVFVIY
jgi:hypothetical protein